MITPLDNVPDEKRQAALLHILQVVATKSAQLMLPVSALGAIALVPQSDIPSVLAGIAGGIGVNLLSSIIERVARNDGLSHQEILDAIETAIDESGIRELISTNDVIRNQITRLASWQRHLAYVIKSGDRELSELLLQQYNEIEVIKADVKLILQQLNQLETRFYKQNESTSHPISKEEIIVSLDSYFRWVIERYGYIYPIHKRKGIPLSQLFVNTFLVESLKYGISNPEQEITDQLWHIRINGFTSEKLKSASELANQTQRLFILGSPGSGKSTFIYQLAVEAATIRKQIPIVLTLKEWDEAWTLEEFIETEFSRGGGIKVDPIWKEWVQSGRLLILLDGLDELSQKRRKKIEINIQRMVASQAYETTQFILTCRTATSNFYIRDFDYFQLASFQPQQVDDFIRNWFVTNPQQAHLMLVALKENKAARELTHTPLLLSLLCLLYERQGRLYVNRAELYERAINVLLVEWDEYKSVSRDYFGLTQTQKHKLFHYLAWQFCNQGTQLKVVASVNDLAKWIQDFWKKPVEASQILRSIESQHGILQEQSYHHYSFSHLTFQEYFTAKYIADHAYFDLCLEHTLDEQWHEIFLLTASSLKSGDNFCIRFLNYLNRMIMQEKEIQELNYLAAHTVRTFEDRTSYSPIVLRIYFLAVTIDRVRRRVNESARRLNPRVVSDRKQHRARSIAHRQTRTFADFLSEVRNLLVESALVLEPSFTVDHLIDVAASRAIALSRYQSLDLDLARDIDHILDNISDKSPQIVSLIESLKDSSIPDSSSSIRDKTKYLESIRYMQLKLWSMMELESLHRTAGEKQKEVKSLLQEIPVQDRVILLDFLKGLSLFVRCFKLANIQDSAAISERLLHP